MVDTAVGFQRGVEIVERPVRGIASGRGFIRIGQYPRGGEGRIDGVVLVDVEIAREDHELPGAAHFADLRDDQFGALLARPDTDVIHMQVEEPEPAPGLPVQEMPPCANAGQRGVPPLVGTVGNFREPEMAFVQQPETLLFIEYGGIFAFGLAVVAPHADIGIVGKLRQHIVQLPVEHLLAAENIEPLEFDQPAYPGAAAFPAVASFGVAFIGVTDIVGGYGQFLRNGREQQHGEQGEGQQSFHSNVFGLTE